MHPLMTRFFVFLLCSAFAGCSCQAQVYRQAAPVHPGAVFPADYQSTLGDSLVILSWNLENFVDGHDDPYVANGRENRGEVDAAKVEAIKEVLLLADADVLVFQETESANWVEQLCEEHWPELGYRYFGGARSRNWYQNVTVASRVPLGVTYSYGSVHTPVVFTEDDQEKYQTQDYINTRLWAVDLLLSADQHLLLTAVHLKAGRSPRDVAMRLGQIRFLKEHLSALSKIYHRPQILLLGDCNTTPGTVEHQALLEEGRRALELIDPLPETVYTHPADKPQRRLDYVFYNRQLARQLGSEPVRVFQPLAPKAMRQISDHLPLLWQMAL